MSELKGFKEVSKKLETVEKRMQQKIVRRGAAKFAQVVRKEMRKNAPKGKSGTLRKELRYKIKKINSGGYEATIGAFGKGFYASFLEFGTKRHALTTKKKKVISVNGNPRANVMHPGQKAQPFLKRSFESSSKRATTEAGKVMFTMISKV